MSMSDHEREAMEAAANAARCFGDGRYDFKKGWRAARRYLKEEPGKVEPGSTPTLDAELEYAVDKAVNMSGALALKTITKEVFIREVTALFMTAAKRFEAARRYVPPQPEAEDRCAYCQHIHGTKKCEMIKQYAGDFGERGEQVCGCLGNGFRDRAG